MHLPRSEQLADYIADRLEFITFLACCSALLALLTGMNGQQALASPRSTCPWPGPAAGMALLCPLPAHWRLPGHSSAAGERSPGHPCRWGATGSTPGHLEPLSALLGLEILWHPGPGAAWPPAPSWSRARGLTGGAIAVILRPFPSPRSIPMKKPVPSTFWSRPRNSV